MQANSLLLLITVFFGLTMAPCNAQDKAAEKAAQKKQAKLEKAWLKIFEEIQKTHEDNFSKARKADLPLKPFQDQWLKALLTEENRASKEIRKNPSPLKRVAKKQHRKIRFERLRFLLSLKRIQAAQSLLAELIQDQETRSAARRLQIAYARRDNPSRLAQIYQDILRSAGPQFPSVEDPQFQLPPVSKQPTLVWIWSKGHPFARHNLTEYLRAMVSHGGQVIALELARSKKSKNKSVEGLTERCLLDPKGKTREALCVNSTPLLLLLNKEGLVVLVDPTAKELDAWFRGKQKGS